MLKVSSAFLNVEKCQTYHKFSNTSVSINSSDFVINVSLLLILYMLCIKIAFRRCVNILSCLEEFASRQRESAVFVNCLDCKML